MDIRKSGGTIGLMDLLGLSRKNASKLDDESAGTFAQLLLQCLMGGAAGLESGGDSGASGETGGDATSFMERDASGWDGFHNKVADMDMVADTPAVPAPDGNQESPTAPSGPRSAHWTEAGGPWDVYRAGLTMWNDPEYVREYHENISTHGAQTA